MFEKSNTKAFGRRWSRQSRRQVKCLPDGIAGVFDDNCLVKTNADSYGYVCVGPELINRPGKPSFVDSVAAQIYCTLSERKNLVGWTSDIREMTGAWYRLCAAS